MNIKPERKHVILCAVSIAVAILGCSRKEAALAPVPVEQVPQLLDNAFQSAPEEIKVEARELSTSVREDVTGTLTELQNLSSRPDLTDEQRQAAARAMASVHARLLEEAAKGNKKADAELEHYRATK